MYESTATIDDIYGDRIEIGTTGHVVEIQSVEDGGVANLEYRAPEALAVAKALIDTVIKLAPDEETEETVGAAAWAVEEAIQALAGEPEVQQDKAALAHLRRDMLVNAQDLMAQTYVGKPYADVSSLGKVIVDVMVNTEYPDVVRAANAA